MNPELFSAFADHAIWLAKKLGPSNRSGTFSHSQTVAALWILCVRSPQSRPRGATVRTDAGVACRFHDLRHTAYTKMVEAGVPEGIIRALMGHVSRAMMDWYSHVRMEAMRTAVESLSLKPESCEVAKETAKEAEAASVH